mgnify:CR=1 FL=1
MVIFSMVHQHFKLVECFTVLDNIILGVEPNKLGFLQKKDARKKVLDLSGIVVCHDAWEHLGDIQHLDDIVLFSFGFRPRKSTS